MVGISPPTVHKQRPYCTQNRETTLVLTGLTGWEVRDGDWCKDFGTFRLCATGWFPSTFLLSGQPATGQRL
jgi:hypothetical protein